MGLEMDEMLDNSHHKKYSSELTTQEKVIIRIKKQEPDVDIEGKDSSSEQEEVVSYTCEFVQKVDDTESELIDVCDEPIESIRQDENFIYPAITNSDDEDTNDVTWQPPSNILTPGDRLTRKHNKYMYSKVEKTVSKKNKCKNNKNNEVTIKRLKKSHLSKSKQVLEDISVSEPATEFTDETTISESITKKNCDSLTPKVGRPRKGMATPKQRLGRIIKIHKMIK
ncbi:PREDICTED: lysine-specific demethylase phf2-like [Diuraphis noxia]|uniref:lysine-specific demethylase phf2-like n=1 Tax=Diuraphis noxia TaxID=143948 RepID=UPI000763A8E8|nr:PREDICTED: lysine-specific demethylase phf2-like [Diuraphis noxia]